MPGLKKLLQMIPEMTAKRISNNILKCNKIELDEIL